MEKTTVEYSQSSSVHGIQYILEGGKNLALSRVIWLVLVVAAAGLGIGWSAEVNCCGFLEQISKNWDLTLSKVTYFVKKV